jgi:predicted DNA repair protein MutK
MFLVGGGILTHGIGPLHHAIEAMAAGLGGVMQAVVPPLADAVLGVVAGGMVWGAWQAASRLKR